jgi:hypothetical protein
MDEYDEEMGIAVSDRTPVETKEKTSFNKRIPLFADMVASFVSPSIAITSSSWRNMAPRFESRQPETQELDNMLASDLGVRDGLSTFNLESPPKATETSVSCSSTTGF